MSMRPVTERSVFRNESLVRSGKFRVPEEHEESVAPHFPKSISPTTTFWELGLGFFGIRVILRGKSGFHGRSKVSEKWS